MNETKTENLPGEPNKSPTTQPMLNAILARINEGFAQVNTLVSEVNQQFSTLVTDVIELRQEVAAFRADTEKHFKLVNNKFSILTDQMLEIQANQKDFEQRIGEQERKAS